MNCPISVRTLLEGWCDTVPDAVITGLALDSRRVAPGQAFVAVAGARTHGMAFARQAFENGAAVIIHDGAADVPALGIPDVAVPGLGERLSALGARFNHHPSDQLAVVGVTGTSGKTSTVHYIAQSWQRFSGDAGLIGDTGYGLFKALKPAGLATPDPISLQGMLAECIDQGVEKVAMEVSSHALDQGRCDDVAFDVAVFTNLERRHLDYHGSMAAYEAAKQRLFLECHPRFAVINHDDAAGKTLARRIDNGTQVLSYGTNGATELRGAILGMDSAGMTLSLASPWGGGEIRTGLMGAYNLPNLLAAAGTLALMGMPWNQVMHQLEIMRPAPGQMQCLGDEPGQPLIVVDEANTPDALEKALQALRSHLRGRLVCVVGCGGETGREARLRKAQAAETLADRVVMTTGTPGSDAPFAVFADAMKGLERPGEARFIEDRAEAIRAAIGECGPGDIVLVTGKGQGTLNIAGSGHRPRSDEATVREVLEAAA